MAFTDIEIARVGFRVRTPDGNLSTEIAQRYSGFPATAAPRFEVRVEPSLDEQQGRLDADEQAEESASRVVVTTRSDSPSYLLSRPDFECRLDLRSARVEARLVPSIFAFDSMLRVVLTLELARARGLLLHAAGLRREGRAYLFFGVSGAGKTTTARLAGDSTVLSDEVVAVRREGKGFRAYATPFAGELGRPGRAGSGEFGALFRLGRPPGPGLERLDPDVAARSLLRSVLYFGGRRSETEALLDTCLELARAVPCYHLRARLDTPIWEQLNGLE